VRIGNVIVESSAASNSENPKWGDTGEDVSVGIFDTFTTVTVDVYDADSGFLGPDDYIGSVSTIVPACNMFVSDQCEERTRLPLGSGSCYLDNDVRTPDPKARCVEFGFRIRPFFVQITDQYIPPSSVTSTRMALAIANLWPRASNNPAAGVWVGNPAPKLNTAGLEFKPFVSGVVLKMNSFDNGLRLANYVTVSVNYACTLAVFRNPVDVEDMPTLAWLNSYTTDTLEVRLLDDDNKRFKGHYKSFAAGSSITLPSAGYQMGNLIPQDQLIVVIKAQVDQSPAPGGDGRKFDRAAFMSLFWQFIFALVPLFAMSGRIIWKLRFRCVSACLRVCVSACLLRAWFCVRMHVRATRSCLAARDAPLPHVRAGAAGSTTCPCTSCRCKCPRTATSRSSRRRSAWASTSWTRRGRTSSPSSS
jgi:hypothetical protein